MKKSCNWASVVVEAIPDTYAASQLDIDNADSCTDFDDKWRHGCRNGEIATSLLLHSDYSPTPLHH